MAQVLCQESANLKLQQEQQQSLSAAQACSTSIHINATQRLQACLHTTADTDSDVHVRLLHPCCEK